MAKTDECCKAASHAETGCCGNGTAVETVSETLSLTGLHCADCAASLEKSLARLPGMARAEVNAAVAKASVSYDPHRTTHEEIVGTIRKLGYDVVPQQRGTATARFRIRGMDCADCAQKLEKKVGALPAVHRVQVNFGAAIMTVEHDGTAVDRVIDTVRQAGYEAVREQEANRREEERGFWRQNKKAWSTVTASLLFLAAWSLGFAPAAPEPLITLLYALSILAGGVRIAKSGLYGLKSRTVGIDFLMTIAVIGAVAIGEWAEGAAVVCLFSLGETLEAYTMDRTRRSLRSLMELAPAEALVLRDGREMTLPVEQIRVGDTILVKPGEKIAMDGVVTDGRSSVNQAPITGESVPVEKGAGDEVFAGTINQQGALTVRVTRRAEDNTLSRIVHLVEEAQAQKAPSQRFVDAFANYYTPAVIAVAVAIAVVPPLLFQQPFADWFYRALMMLVVSCPCALVISTPVSIVSAIGNAARSGILIKGGVHLERLGAVSVMAFDKTGTLTQGHPEVTGIIPVSALTEAEVLAIAAAVEARSEHPLAAAIVRKAKQEGVAIPESDQFVSVPGGGVKARVDGITYVLGNPRWISGDVGLSLERVEQRIEQLRETGHTLMVLGTEQQVVALITLADAVRPSSRTAIRELRSLGIERVVMLTGDHRGTARAVSSELGGIDCHAELLPEDKLTLIREWQSAGAGVAMVGDGVNDAPALAAATVGIAMGGAGSDTALETADITLMADDLSKLPYAVSLSRRTLRIIKQNIAFSLLVKAVFLLMIVFGWSTLWMAVLADTGSSLIVIANGMRLLRSADRSRPLPVRAGQAAG
ncbi:cadmium-translocating P-type ATPase [Brevibacillus sp. LEMMJ03]|uniref:heavy metal translocating P-type ATPase n=1 Tax=Brevibacillus sp. LEMMJ03 TaxID=2595056 RepID=UPI00117F9D57|nr:heavy metal translocating P-type ATPase [Brevibacillus sp. LEMMJ03]TRY27020.1 cadmium-translocating P-type ATPase [Brevibacillus sp. LEMMJ03]